MKRAILSPFIGLLAALSLWTGWPQVVSAAPANAKPNFLIILADDMGFSDAGCYGGEIHTPNLDRLAANGLRFTQFYNTARCWPTRSSLLTGYYAQQIGMDPRRGRLPAWTRVLPHYLKPLGYRCYQSGKWHLTGAPKPVADGGFDHSYRFEDWDRYFSPAKHFEDDHPAAPVKPDSGYYATTAFADHALGYLRDHATNHAAKPFFLYLAFIAPHFPLHAPPEDIARYRDRYREGWDVIRAQRWERIRQMRLLDCALPPLDPGFTPRYFKPEVLEQLGPGETEHPVVWETLTAEQQAFQATKMAVHAAMVDRMDRGIGRVLDQLRIMGALDNTFICFLSDNGADATLLVRGEGHDPGAPAGSWRSFQCLGPGWASACNTPFRWHKIWVHEGGIATPLIVHWPNGIKARGELRHDPGHVVDFVPTLLDLAGARITNVWNGIEAPPLPGKSLVPAFRKDGTVKREFIFFHHEGNRALRVGNWKVVSARENDNRWELYNLGKDRSELHDLAARQPERASRMESRWKELERTFRRQYSEATTESSP
ncbi:MAG TPA: arylsulfatase [Candidatus Paceibacterota bacterium]|nr:arylsulfatase [Verrucomicrobiota bacterium]HSA09053.1 arylsulfatase [Candidatus Paceibacterota bacterium]